MKTKKANKSCRAIRNWLGSIMSNSIGLDADWVQKHIAGCPRCQRRLASTGKVHLALSIIKSRPHKLDLLMRANLGALKMLKHSLRDCPKAQKLTIKSDFCHNCFSLVKMVQANSLRTCKKLSFILAGCGFRPSSRLRRTGRPAASVILTL